MSLLNNKYLFVHINKSGGGVITENFRQNGDTKLTGYHRKLEDFLILAKAQYKLNKDDLYIFTIVRNPWDRMLSLYLFYKNKHPSPEFYSGISEIDDNFNNWIEYIYSDKFDKTRNHSRVNIFKYCFSNQLNWLKDKNNNLININKILKYEDHNLNEFLKNEINLKKIDTVTRIHPTNHQHYSKYYNEKSTELVRKHFLEDIEYFNYSFERI